MERRVTYADTIDKTRRRAKINRDFPLRWDFDVTIRPSGRSRQSHPHGISGEAQTTSFIRSSRSDYFCRTCPSSAAHHTNMKTPCRRRNIGENPPVFGELYLYLDREPRELGDAASLAASKRQCVTVKSKRLGTHKPPLSTFCKPNLPFFSPAASGWLGLPQRTDASPILQGEIQNVSDPAVTGSAQGAAERQL